MKTIPDEYIVECGCMYLNWFQKIYRRDIYLSNDIKTSSTMPAMDKSRSNMNVIRLYPSHENAENAWHHAALIQQLNHLSHTVEISPSHRHTSRTSSLLLISYTVSSPSSPFHFLYNLLCCSKNKKVTTVCGPNLTKLGTHPLHIQPGPSILFTLVNNLTNPSLSPLLMILVLMTSTGLQTVVATKPAIIEAEKWVVRLSVSGVCWRSRDLKTS